MLSSPAQARAWLLIPDIPGRPHREALGALLQRADGLQQAQRVLHRGRRRRLHRLLQEGAHARLAKSAPLQQLDLGPRAQASPQSTRRALGILTFLSSGAPGSGRLSRLGDGETESCGAWIGLRPHPAPYQAD